MPYFKITLSMTPGQNVRASVVFPEDCYVGDGGVAGAPSGHSIPPGEYGYIIHFRKGPSCNQGDTVVNWSLPFTPDQTGQLLTVFLVNKSNDEVEDEEKGGQVVKPNN
jgi:hypothetical protein